MSQLGGVRPEIFDGRGRTGTVEKRPQRKCGSEPMDTTTPTETTRDPKESVDFKLSIVVPAYNEEASVRGVIEELEGLKFPFEHEIIVVDDGSTDTTYERATETNGAHTVVLQHDKNRGKGAAVRTGIAACSGSHVLIFDADDEYDPHDITELVVPLMRGRAEVVYGTRLRGHGTIHPTLIHSVGNWIMTGTANVLYGSAISDLHTCLKLLPVPLLREMSLTEEGFGLDTEITAEMLRRGWRPYELPISYVGRSKEEGKKIGAGDAFDCFRILFKVRRRGRVRPGLRDRRLSPPIKVRP